MDWQYRVRHPTGNKTMDKVVCIVEVKKKQNKTKKRMVYTLLINVNKSIFLHIERFVLDYRWVEEPTQATIYIVRVSLDNNTD